MKMQIELISLKGQSISWYLQKDNTIANYCRDGLNTTLVRPGHNTESIKQTLRCLAEHYVDNLEGRQMMISTFRVV